MMKGAKPRTSIHRTSRAQILTMTKFRDFHSLANELGGTGQTDVAACVCEFETNKKLYLLCGTFVATTIHPLVCLFKPV